MMVWGCFATSRPGQLTIFDKTINFDAHKKKKNLKTRISDNTFVMVK